MIKLSHFGESFLEFLNSTLEKILSLSNIEELKNKLNNGVGGGKYNELVQENILENNDLIDGKDASLNYEDRLKESQNWINIYLDSFLGSTSPSSSVDESEFVKRLSPLITSSPSSPYSSSDPQQSSFARVEEKEEKVTRMILSPISYLSLKEEQRRIDRENIVSNLVKYAENMKSITNSENWRIALDSLKEEIEKYENTDYQISSEDIGRIYEKVAEAEKVVKFLPPPLPKLWTSSYDSSYYY